MEGGDVANYMGESEQEDNDQTRRLAKDSREKAIKAVQAESGIEHRKLLRLRIRDIVTKDQETKLYVGVQNRSDPLIIEKSTPYLKAWLTHHPMRDDPDAPLWLTAPTVDLYRQLKSDSQAYRNSNQGEAE